MYSCIPQQLFEVLTILSLLKLKQTNISGIQTMVSGLETTTVHSTKNRLDVFVLKNVTNLLLSQTGVEVSYSMFYKYLRYIL